MIDKLKAKGVDLIEIYGQFPRELMANERFFDPPSNGQSLFFIDDSLSAFEDKTLSQQIEELFIRRSHHQASLIYIAAIFMFFTKSCLGPEFGFDPAGRLQKQVVP